MKRVLRFFLDIFFKFMCSNYIIYVFFGICFFPIVILVSGFQGAFECYFENKDLSYKKYKDTKQDFINIRKTNKK